jgi:hypothetical protein
MNSTLLKSNRANHSKPQAAPPPQRLPWAPSPEDCFVQFAHTLKNIGDFPIHWLNTFRIQSSDMKLMKTLRVNGEKGLTCVIRTSPRLENYLQERANPLARVGGTLFDRLAVEFIQRMSHLCLGTTLMVAPEIQPGMPKALQEREPDVICKVLIDVTFVEILLYREPLPRR